MEVPLSLEDRRTEAAAGAAFNTDVREETSRKLDRKQNILSALVHTTLLLELMC